ncbi:hypothetical protein VaNZ11_014747, partial [Volvox africanus]
VHKVGAGRSTGEPLRYETAWLGHMVRSLSTCNREAHLERVGRLYTHQVVLGLPLWMWRIRAQAALNTVLKRTAAMRSSLSNFTEVERAAYGLLQQRAIKYFTLRVDLLIQRMRHTGTASTDKLVYKYLLHNRACAQGIHLPEEWLFARPSEPCGVHGRVVKPLV